MAYRETESVRARKAAQRRHLLVCAEQLVRDGGFANLTMQTLADRAGVGVGTLYRYFDNKGGLAAEVFRRATEREVAAVAQAMEQGVSVAERLTHVLQDFVRRAQAAPTLAWSLIAEPVDPEVDVERLRYRQRYAGLYQSLLDQGVADGELPRQDTAVVAAAMVGAIAESLVGPLAAPLPKAGLADALLVFCLRAIGLIPAQGTPL
ncbi:MAG: TetR/AcrR family transcriptional regulator [Alcanivorax sp.]|nr:TetR/AcrR family transcriptional regulator [Alcanivorax sp.]